MVRVISRWEEGFQRVSEVLQSARLTAWRETPDQLTWSSIIFPSVILNSPRQQCLLLFHPSTKHSFLQLQEIKP
ncbi:unnamed protein product [Boreogadus saida]